VVYGEGIDESTIRAIGTMKHLERLYIHVSRMRVKDVGLLCKLPHLKSLDLSGNRLDGDLVSMLRGFQALTTVNVTNTGLSMEQIAALRKIVATVISDE
jgi:hypothetical protein